MHKERNLRAESATVIDASYSRHGFSPSPLLRDFGAAIVQRANAPAPGLKRIYVSRRDSKNRATANEADVEAFMTARGIHCVTLSGLSFPEQVALFNGAELIVASHGAGLANTVFCRPGTRVVEFAPTSYMNPCFLKIGQTLDLNWELYGFAAPQAARQQEISWSVDLRFLAEVL